MLDIKKNVEDDKVTLQLKGRLDTTTADNLQEIVNDLPEVKTLIFDFKELDYISSAGLRILLQLQKQMMDKGEMIVENCNSSVLEVFEITGFKDFLTIR